MKALIAVIMGSKSDWNIMKEACIFLEEIGIPYEKKIVSAHRTPDWLYEFAENASEKGIKVIIAGAGGAAHLPGMVAAKTVIPVIGVPIPATHLQGMDSLLSIVQMPAGVPVATVAIGAAGAKNAALLSAQILGLSNNEIQQKMKKLRKKARESVMEANKMEDWL